MSTAQKEHKKQSLKRKRKKGEHDDAQELKLVKRGRFTCFQLAGTKLTGIHHYIEKNFFPTGLSEKSFYNWLGECKLTQEECIQSALRRERKTSVVRFRRGKLAGTKLQKEMDAYLKHVAKPRAKPYKPTLVETKAVIGFLKRRKWTLIAVDLPVASEKARIGTGVDLLCKTKEGKYVVIEVKRTTSHYRYIAQYPRLKLRGRFSKLPVSMQSLAHVQLLYTAALYRKWKHVPFESIEGCYVVAVFANTIRSGLSHMEGIWCEPLMFAQELVDLDKSGVL
jgi:hypothetical protein